MPQGVEYSTGIGRQHHKCNNATVYAHACYTYYNTIGNRTKNKANKYKNQLNKLWNKVGMDVPKST